MLKEIIGTIFFVSLILGSLFLGYTLYPYLNETSFFLKNNIQASHIDLDYKQLDGGIFIENSELSVFAGVSMQPTMFSKNFGILQKYTKSFKLEEGQIVSTQDGLTHRIKAIYTDEIILQGDNNRYEDVINKSDIEYIVVGVLFT